jgi:hypothetical protein
MQSAADAAAVFLATHEFAVKPGKPPVNQWSVNTANRVKTGGAAHLATLPLERLPEQAKILRKDGFHDEAKQMEDYHAGESAKQAAIKAAQPQAPAPQPWTSTVTNTTPVPGYVSPLDAAGRKKALLAFHKHPNAKPLIDAHAVNTPGLDKKEALTRLGNAYEAYHAQNAPQQPQSAQPAASAAGGQRPPLTTRMKFGINLVPPEKVAAIAPKASIINPRVSPHPPEPDMAWTQRGLTPEEKSQLSTDMNHAYGYVSPSSKKAAEHAAAINAGQAVPDAHVKAVLTNLVKHGHRDAAIKLNKQVEERAKAQQAALAPTVEMPVTAPVSSEIQSQPSSPVVAAPRPRNLPARSDRQGGRTPLSAFLPQQSDGSQTVAATRPGSRAAMRQIAMHGQQDTIAPKFGGSSHAPGRFAQLLQAARAGKLKEHLENGLGNFFDRFEHHGNKLLRKIGIPAGEEFSRREVAAIEFLLTSEFARHKPDDRQRGFVFDAPAKKGTGWTPPVVERKARQKSFAWKEGEHPRESAAHDNKRPGEFAKKDESHTEEPEADEKPKYVAKGNEVFGVDGVRHAAFRNEEKAKAAADEWNLNGKPNGQPKPVVPRVIPEDLYPSLKGNTPNEMTTGKLVDHLNATIPKEDLGVAKVSEEVSGNVPEAEQKSNFNKLADFGEKIGGARKDTAGPSESRGSKKKSDEPGWRSRYSVGEIAASSDKSEVGKWSVTDNRKTDWLGQPRSVGKFDTKEKAEAAIPLAEVARNHSVTNVAKKGEPDDWAIYRKVSDTKRPVIKGGFSSRDEAMKYMATNPIEIIETKTRIDDSIHPELEKIVREGETHRKGNIDESDFKKFGFRGVEFGNWNNSPERQHIVNHAYDSLTDMAKILGIPDKAVSLDGDLGIGFGSRGHGLSGARAHYEPDYVAINLTKMKGAGSLAHEWWHAFDHWVGRLSGKASSEWLKKGGDGDSVLDAKGSGGYPSHGFGYRKKDGFRKEVEEAFNGVMNAITKKDVEYTEDKTRYEKVHEQYGSKVASKLDEVRKAMLMDYSKDKYPYYKGKKGQPASPEMMKQVDDLIEKIKNDEFGEHIYHGQNDALNRHGHRMAENVAKLADLHKKLRGNSGYSKTSGRLHGIIASLAGEVDSRKYAMERLSEAAEQKVKTKTAPTDFVAEASAMDLGTKGDYWSEKHELAARAFESYVYDKIKAAGHRDDFLAYEKHNNLPKYRFFNVKPYPEGDERSRMNTAFDKLFETMKDHELSGKTERKKTERILPTDDGTWEGHWGSRGASPSQISSLKRSIGQNEGVVHINKKGTQASFYNATRNRKTVDELMKMESITKKPGKLFAVRTEPKEFSRVVSEAYFAFTGQRASVHPAA